MESNIRIASGIINSTPNQVIDTYNIFNEDGTIKSANNKATYYVLENNIENQLELMAIKIHNDYLDSKLNGTAISYPTEVITASQTIINYLNNKVNGATTK